MELTSAIDPMAGRYAGYARLFQQATVQKTKPGDYLLCYLTQASRRVGLLGAMVVPICEVPRMASPPSCDCSIAADLGRSEPRVMCEVPA
jgi:hypothetical protein